MTNNSQSVKYVKPHLAKCIDHVREGGGPVIITQNGATVALLVNAAEYERTQHAFAILKRVVMADKNIREGRVYTHDEVFADARKRAAEIRKAKAERKPAR